MSIVDYLLSSASPLLKTKDWSPPDIVYFSLYDRMFIRFSMASADKAYTAMTAVAVAVTAMSGVWWRWRPFVIALLSTPIAFLVGMASAVGTAGIMILLDKQMTW